MNTNQTWNSHRAHHSFHPHKKAMSHLSFYRKLSTLWWGLMLSFPLAFHIKMPSYQHRNSHYKDEIDGLVQERRNSSALAMELRLSCTNPACVITWLCTDSPLPDCYIVLLITPKHPTHSNTGTVTVAELSCTHSFPHNDPMHGFGDECVQYYSQPQSCTHV